MVPRLQLPRVEAQVERADGPDAEGLRKPLHRLLAVDLHGDMVEIDRHPDVEPVARRGRLGAAAGPASASASRSGNATRARITAPSAARRSPSRARARAARP